MNDDNVFDTLSATRENDSRLLIPEDKKNNKRKAFRPRRVLSISPCCTPSLAVTNWNGRSNVGVFHSYSAEETSENEAECMDTILPVNTYTECKNSFFTGDSDFLNTNKVLSSLNMSEAVPHQLEAVQEDDKEVNDSPSSSSTTSNGNDPSDLDSGKDESVEFVERQTQLLMYLQQLQSLQWAHDPTLYNQLPQVGTQSFYSNCENVINHLQANNQHQMINLSNHLEDQSFHLNSGETELADTVETSVKVIGSEKSDWSLNLTRAQKQMQCMRTKRKDPEYCRKERERDRQRKQLKRQNPEIRAREREADRKRLKLRRLDPLYRAQERQRQRERLRQKRQDPVFRQKERERDKIRKQLKRQHPELLEVCVKQEPGMFLSQGLTLPRKHIDVEGSALIFNDRTWELEETRSQNDCIHLQNETSSKKLCETGLSDIENQVVPHGYLEFTHWVSVLPQQSTNVSSASLSNNLNDALL
ncbi:myotubularin-related protein DDB_G0290005-like isoform X2 [Limulus polyphemus]|uniref:Myotubularin-related protein DDB_G0290005-like isoform X2 n=1 Tax=Limulus polyphemus TaxID=6850 RepID=A0ABM1BX01_LIMPO|nr:myotubularin-related protein DDB_G0290005-like isoform X2 [Limulus polyphemus]